MGHVKRFVIFLLSFTLLLPTISCTPEKAKALQTAATSFSSEAESAITTLQQLFTEDVGATIESEQDDVESIFRTLEREKSVSAATLSELLTGSRFVVPALEQSNQEFSALQAQYAQFAAMYQSLDRGYLFAGKSVRESEAVSIKLTVQLVKFAEMVKQAPFQLRVRRVLLIEKINRAYQISDAAGRSEALRSAAQDVVQLQKDEAAANEKAIKQCLKAAEAGRVATNLIRNYDKTSIADMLNAVNNSLTLISDISKDQNVPTLLKKYAAIKTTIETDPYWSPLLNQVVNSEGAHATR